MADQNDTKAEEDAEKAYAEATEQVNPKNAVEAKAPKPKPKPKPDASKTAKAVDAEVGAKAAPKKAVAKKKKAAAAKAKPTKARKASAKAKPKAKAKAKAAKSAAKPASNTKPRISKLKDTVMANAKNSDFNKTAQNAATELQIRVKSAYEKSQAYAGEMTEFNKGNFDAFVESGKIVAAGMQKLARSEAEAARGALETVTADLKAMAAVKSPTELFKLQGEIARRNFDAAVAHYSKNAEVSMKLANEAFAPLSSRASRAAEKISKAA